MAISIVLLKTLGLAAGAIIVILVMMSFQIKVRTKDKIYCLFIPDNKHVRTTLIKPDSGQLPLGKGADKTKYLASKERQFEMDYPPGFPSMLQQSVRALMFVQGQAEPINIYNTKSMITALTLMKISDEALLKAMWRDVKESVGLKAGGFNSKLVYLILILSAVGAVGSITLVMRSGGFGG